ncbi:MAG: hypothetical protein OEZ54_12570 [Gemmatimonadota bacterium]|nr:hypothetical protein [Gemmatimonadota bacterium]
MAFGSARSEVLYDQLACVEGRADRCRAALANMTSLDRNEQSFPYYSNTFYYYDPHAIFRTFMADLVREIGPERFEELWQSEEVFETAFTETVGKSLPVWTAGWAQRFPANFFWGPDLRAREFFFAMFCAALAAVTAMVVANRVRQKT